MSAWSYFTVYLWARVKGNYRYLNINENILIILFISSNFTIKDFLLKSQIITLKDIHVADLFN